jgi:hypothetical protein
MFINMFFSCLACEFIRGRAMSVHCLGKLSMFIIARVAG